MGRPAPDAYKEGTIVTDKEQSTAPYVRAIVEAILATAPRHEGKADLNVGVVLRAMQAVQVYLLAAAMPHDPERLKERLKKWKAA
jgi:hypothetical protein